MGNEWYINGWGRDNMDYWAPARAGGQCSILYTTDVQSRLADAQTRVDRAQSRLVDTEERRDRARAAEDDFNSWDLQVLEAKDALMDYKLDLVKTKQQLAKINGMVVGTVDDSLAVEVAQTEFDKAAVKFELERKRCIVSAGNEKSSFLKQYEERLRIATEILSLAHDNMKRNILNTTQEYSCAAFAESPNSGSKCKADVGVVPGDCKMPRAGSPNKRENLPAWQWRHSDGIWMTYSDFDSALLEEARNRRERKCNVTASGVTFVIDFERMEQRRSEAGTEAAGSSGGPAEDSPRPVRRFQEEWSQDSMLQWNTHIREVYPSRDFQTTEVQSYAVLPGTGDYHPQVCKLFYSFCL
jgi:hypothetical protein